MLTSIIVTGVIAGALGYALRVDAGGELIVHRPYANRYNDASGAREDPAAWQTMPLRTSRS